MAKKKDEESVSEEIVVQNGDNITIHEDKWDGTVNTNVSDELPSLND